MPKSVRAAASWSAASLSVCAVAAVAVLVLALGLGAVHAGPLSEPLPAGLSGWDVAWYGLTALQGLHPAAQGVAVLGIIAAATSVARAYVRRVTGPEFQAAVVEALTEQNRTIGRLAEQIGAAIEGVNQLRVDVVRHTLDCPAARSGRSSQGAIS